MLPMDCVTIQNGCDRRPASPPCAVSVLCWHLRERQFGTVSIVAVIAPQTARCISSPSDDFGPIKRQGPMSPNELLKAVPNSMPYERSSATSLAKSSTSSRDVTGKSTRRKSSLDKQKGVRGSQ